MNTFTSFASTIEKILNTIVRSDRLHARWLNTLSFLENCGARKIAGCEHPTLVKEEMLKHASEEFRHAHYLKRQIEKISTSLCDYSLPFLLGGTTTLHYLKALDIHSSRYLKSLGFSQKTIKEYSYLLVTYAIELRAEELYPIYEKILRKAHSRIVVKSILLEEKEHLEEMRKGLLTIPSGLTLAHQICLFESDLCKKWLTALETTTDSITTGDQQNQT